MVEAAYGAGTGASPWTEFGDLLCRATGASMASILTGSLAEGRVALRFCANIPAEAQHAYDEHYHRHDLWVRRATLIGPRAGPGDPPPVRLGQELVCEAAFQESAIYNDYLRRLDIFRIVGSLMPLGEAGDLGLALYRPKRGHDFDERERRLLL
jgi:hypothetical protein